VLTPDDLPDNHPLEAVQQESVKPTSGKEKKAQRGSSRKHDEVDKVQKVQESTKPTSGREKKAARGSSSKHAELGRHGITLHRMSAGRGLYHVRTPGQSLGVVVHSDRSPRPAKGTGKFHAIAKLKSGGFSARATAHASVPEAAMALARHHGIRMLEGHRGKLYPSDIHGYDNLRGGKPRPVEPMTDDKLAHFAKHPDTHPELRKRVRAEIRRRKAGGQRQVFRRAAPIRPRPKPRAPKKISEANWMAGAVKRPGQLHRDLGVPEGENIPAAMIRKAAASHDDPQVRARARLALTFAKHRRARAAVPG
jgi:hypothetical protein